MNNSNSKNLAVKKIMLKFKKTQFNKVAIRLNRITNRIKTAIINR